MLSSRYLYLHEALGLGPMWLQQSARVAAAAHPSAGTTRTTTQHTAPNAVQATAIPLPEADTQHTGGLQSAQHALQAIRTQLSARQAPQPAATATPYVAHAIITSELPADQTATTATELPAILAACQRCALRNERRQPMAGHGALPARLMVISPNPSPADDSAHTLFSGDVGLLLSNMLHAIGIQPNDVFYTSQVKCTPNVSLHVQAEHIAACQPYLQQQLSWVQPHAVLLLGKAFSHMDKAALQHILRNIPYVIIPHPARLLRQPTLKAQAWTLLQQLLPYLHP